MDGCLGAPGMNGVGNGKCVGECVVGDEERRDCLLLLLWNGEGLPVSFSPNSLSGCTTMGRAGRLDGGGGGGGGGGEESRGSSYILRPCVFWTCCTRNHDELYTDLHVPHVKMLGSVTHKIKQI